MSNTQIKTRLVIVDQLSSDAPTIKSVKRIEVPDGTGDNDAVNLKQLNAVGNANSFLTDDNAFEGDNEFIKPVTAAAGTAPGNLVTLDQLQKAVSFRLSYPVNGGDILLNWQTDFVAPGKTFAEVFGNSIFKALLTGDDGTGFVVSYEANLRYTQADGKINQVAIENILYPGKLTFI